MKHVVRFALLAAYCLLPTSYFGAPAHATFVDVDTTHPYFHGIDFLQAENVVEGFQKEGTDYRYFRPLQEVTRGEAAKMLTLSAKMEILREGLGDRFPDIRRADWQAPFVETLAKRKIVVGHGDGRFHPGANIGLPAFTKMVLLSFGIDIPEARGSEQWFTPVMQRAKELHISLDNDHSEHIITRGEAAEMIFRAKTVSLNDMRPYTFWGSGTASFYNKGFAGKVTASGEIYDPFDLTAAHRVLPFGTKIKVYNEDGKSIVVRINDRGPYHKERVLDLSQRGFETLAPISRGIIKIRFEVLSQEGRSAKPAIPETIRPKLKEESSRNPITPTVIRQRMEEKKVSKKAETVQEALIRASQEPTPENPSTETNDFVEKVQQARRDRSLFGHSVGHISQNFYPDMWLRRTIPQKVPVGTVLLFSGRLQAQGPKQGIVFLHHKGDLPQRRFETPVSGTNLSVPIAFLDKGTFHLGVVFDDEKRSKVAPIEVVEPIVTRDLPPQEDILDGEYFTNANVVPEEQKVYFEWNDPGEAITELRFEESPEIQNRLVIEDRITRFGVPYDFFDIFTPGKSITITRSVAPAPDLSFRSQEKDWQQVNQLQFQIIEGFPDHEEKEMVQVSDFKRFVHHRNAITLQGKKLETDLSIREVAYLTPPDGVVREIPVIFTGGDFFEIKIDPADYGTHIIEIMGEGGNVLFNRAIYFYDRQVLPIHPWSQQKVKGTLPQDVRNWINQFRKAHHRRQLNPSRDLEIFAQYYAERMAKEGFLSHTDPEGRTFQERIEEAQLSDQYVGENIGFGDTIDLALQSLENSGGHRTNIIDPKWTNVGVGIARNTKGQWYVVQVFGK